MKLKTFTLYAVAAVSIALTSCNKLTSPQIDFNTGLISVNVKTNPIDTADVIASNGGAEHTVVEKIDSMDIQKTLDSSISYAVTKGFVVTQTAILDGTVNNIVIENANPNDTRSFHDYFTYFDVRIKTNNDDRYNVLGWVDISSGNVNSVNALVEGAKFKTYLPAEIPAKGIKTPLFVKIYSNPKRVILPGQEFLLKVSVNSTIKVTKK
ncbi:MAG: hypothetical protein ACOYMA_14265 [Bacteroidia bacterium]